MSAPVQVDERPGVSASLRITEIFHSIQGEADAVGWPTVFVRLTGCPLRCTWCDTTYAFSGGQSMPLPVILDAVGAYGAGRLPLAELKRIEDRANALCKSWLESYEAPALDPAETAHHRLETLEVEQDSAAMLAHHALAAGAVSAALAHSLAAGEEALRVSATHEARAHLDNARRLVQEAALAGAENEARLRDLYAQLGQAFELIDDPAQAAEAYADRGRLSSNRPRS